MSFLKRPCHPLFFEAAGGARLRRAVLYLFLPAVAGGVVERSLSGGAEHTILGEPSVGVTIGEALERLEVRGGDVGGAGVVKVDGVVGGVRVRPPKPPEDAAPVVVVGGINRAAALVVGLAGLGGERDAALTAQVHAVE